MYCSTETSIDICGARLSREREGEPDSRRYLQTDTTRNCRLDLSAEGALSRNRADDRQN